MKLLSYLSHATLLTGAAFLLGLTFDVQILPLFGLAITTALLLLASGDYAPSATRFARWQLQSRRSGPPPRRGRYTLPFAV